MRTKAIASAAAAALLAGWVGSAHAGTVTFSADQTTVGVGDLVTFTYTMDFSDDSTLGGGTDIWYDSSVLQFVGWSFDAGLSSDNPNFRLDPTNCLTTSDPGCDADASEFAGMAQLNGLAWGNDSGNGMSGPAVIGQMVFQAIGIGVTDIFMAANDDGVSGDPGPFVSGNTFTVQDVTFSADSVTVVPVPAAVWMLLSALGALGGVRRFG